MRAFHSLKPADIPQTELHAILLASVAPRPIALCSTINSKGEKNLSPFSFFNVFSSNPPILVFSPSLGGKDALPKDTLINVREVNEVVVHVCNYAMAHQISLSSAAYPYGVNEFIKAGFSEIPSLIVRPPRLAEAPVAFECRVNEVKELGQGRGAGNLVICEILYIHIRTKFLDSLNHPDTCKLDLIGRMGGNWYNRTNKKALFQIPKPLAQLGIGVDSLPNSVQNSKLLSGNHLGQLGGLYRMEIPKSSDPLFKDLEFKEVKAGMTKDNYRNEREIHRLAVKWIDENKTEMALALLLWFEVNRPSE